MVCDASVGREATVFDRRWKCTISRYVHVRWEYERWLIPRYSPRDTVAAAERLLDEVRDVRLVQQGEFQLFQAKKTIEDEYTDPITERFNTRTFTTKAKSYERFESSKDTRPGATNISV